MTRSRNLHLWFAFILMLVLLLIFARSVDAQSPGSIGIYFDEMGTACSGIIDANVPGTVYVIAKMDGSNQLGLAAAEFRFAGVC